MIKQHKRDDLVKMFCAYCRRTLLNARTDFARRKARRAKHERLFSDMRERELERLAGAMALTTEETVFDVNGKLIGVDDPDLAGALAALSEESRAIVLLSFFAGWSDRQIGEELALPRSTVQWKRMRALRDLRVSLSGKGGDADDYL